MYVQLFFFLQRKGRLKNPRLASHLSLNSLKVLLCIVHSAHSLLLFHQGRHSGVFVVAFGELAGESVDMCV